MSPVQEKNTRLTILQVAKDFLSEGNINPSMSEIAKKCGLTKSALYYFFQNKKDLILGVMQSTLVELHDGLLEITEKKSNPEKKLRNMMAFATDFFYREKSVSRDIFRQIFAQDEELLRLLYEERKKVVGLFAQVIDEGKNAKVFRNNVDAKKSAEVICGFIDFLGICFTMPCPVGEKKCEMHPTELCDQLVDLFLPQ